MSFYKVKNTNKSIELHNKHEKITSELYGIAGVVPYRFVFILTNLCNLKNVKELNLSNNEIYNISLSDL